LAQILDEFRGVRNCKRLPRFKVSKILVWADAHCHRTGNWPQKDSGPIVGAPGETWLAVEMALHHGRRGLPGGSSLARLLAEKRGKRNFGNLPTLPVKRILSAADAHFRRTGSWPHVKSGPIPELPGESWNRVQKALVAGFRGLPGGSSLYQLLVAHGRIKPIKPRGLRKRRAQAGFSRRDLATKLGMSYSRVVAWEQGRGLPRPETLVKLAGTLNVSVANLREEMKAVCGARTGLHDSR
jgi:DNA-binding XRE family transcriptional regulator